MHFYLIPRSMSVDESDVQQQKQKQQTYKMCFFNFHFCEKTKLKIFQLLLNCKHLTGLLFNLSVHVSDDRNIIQHVLILFM